jgi:formylglycine-generating enzyme required for sulfatase activity
VTDGDTLGLEGRTIAEKYLVERVVGEGGFAVVYRAMHVIWKRPVALKVFKALGDVSEEHRKKLLDEFIQEGALLADLSARSAAIVQARDIGMLEAEGAHNIPYMVLEWLEGASLEDVLADEKTRGLPPRSIADAVQLLEPAAEALALAHRKGIAHRDVKPANIFVIGEPRGEATVKLLDFGIAKVVGDMQKAAGTFNKTSGQVTSFTPAYGAPEQFSRSHGATGPWTDVFSLALMLLETISGQEPLAGDDIVQLAVASGNTERRPTPRAFGIELSDDLEATFAKAVAVKPTERWQSAGEFWSALRGALHMAPMRMSDESARSLPGSRVTSDPLVAAAATVLAPSGTLPASASAASTKRASATTGGTPSGSGKMGLFVALGAAAVAAIVVGAVVVEKGTKGPPAAAAHESASVSAPPPSVSSMASATPAPACPVGMIQIPGGPFYMGSDDGLPFEKPSHQVVLDPYCIDEYEVTTEKYKACSDAGRCKRASTTNESAGIAEQEKKALDPLCNIRDPAGRAKHPINCVDWAMAEKYCREQGGRLPTEAEWEFAARGPDGRKYPWGEDDPTTDLLNACGKECMAWGAKNGVKESAMYDADDGFPNTAPVGSFPKGASRYGLKDVVGNVWEWVEDYYGPYAKDEQKNPKGPTTGEERVVRGGSWNASVASWVRPTFRYKAVPGERSYGVGFRCAK